METVQGDVCSEETGQEVNQFVRKVCGINKELYNYTKYNSIRIEKHNYYGHFMDFSFAAWGDVPIYHDNYT